jgi:hypothetical protein
MSSEVRRHTVQGGAWDLSDRHLNACPLARVKQKIHRHARECAPIVRIDDSWRSPPAVKWKTMPTFAHALLDTLQLSRRYRLSACDASYLELAPRSGASMATYGATRRPKRASNSSNRHDFTGRSRRPARGGLASGRLKLASLRRESSNRLLETLEEWNDYLERYL